jgi:Tfp pilus assembly protein PilO
MKPGLRDLSFGSLLLGLVAGAYATIIRPHAIARRERQEEIRQMDREIRAVGSGAARMNELAHQIDRQESSVALFDGLLPHEAEFSKAIDEVLETAAANSLQSSDARVIERVTANGLSSQSVLFHFKGSFKAFYAFLLQWETLHRPAKIDHLILQNAGDGQVSVDMAMKLFCASAVSRNTGVASAN